MTHVGWDRSSGGLSPSQIAQTTLRQPVEHRKGSSSGHDFHWFGPAKEFLERLRKVLSGSGVEAVRSEFS